MSKKIHSIIDRLKEAVRERRLNFYIMSGFPSVHECNITSLNLQELSNYQSVYDELNRIVPTIEKPKYKSSTLICEFHGDNEIDIYGFSIGMESLETMGLLLKENTPIVIPKDFKELNPSKRICLHILSGRDKNWWITDCWVDDKKIDITLPKQLPIIFDLDEKVIRLGRHKSGNLTKGEIKMIEYLYNGNGRASYEKLEEYLRGGISPHSTDPTNNIRNKRSTIRKKIKELFHINSMIVVEILPYDDKQRLQELNLDRVEVYKQSLNFQYDFDELFKRAIDYRGKAIESSDLVNFNNTLTTLEFLMILLEDGTIEIGYEEAMKCLTLYAFTVVYMSEIISKDEASNLYSKLKYSINKLQEMTGNKSLDKKIEALLKNKTEEEIIDEWFLNNF